MTTILTPAEAGDLNFRLHVVSERNESIVALVFAIEDDLAARCRDGVSPPDYAPLQAWHLARVLRGIVESVAAERDFNQALDQHLPEAYRPKVGG